MSSHELLLKSIEINPKNSAKASVIWLHGLGATSDDFVPIVPTLNLPESLAVRFVFPQAPIHPVTINNGMHMPAWFDIKGLGLGAEEDRKGIQKTQLKIEELIQHENQRGVPSHKIVLAGFSQGGAMALHTGLRYPEKLAGILGLSCYLPLGSELAKDSHPANKKTSILIIHGTQDQVVLWQWADFSRTVLEDLNYPVEFHTYPMAHTVCEEEVHCISRWLKEILSDAS